MPTVLRTEGFRFFFYSNEGDEPPHVHVEAQEGTVKFWLQPVRQAGRSRIRKGDLGRIQAIVVEKAQDFVRNWNEHFQA